MSRLTHLMIHCLDTPEGRDFHKEDVELWHTGPKPPHRGWSKPGYSDLVILDGSLEQVMPYDMDDYVDSWEISNGARGWNGRTRHIAYVGGKDKQGNAKDTRTHGQLVCLATYVKVTIRAIPDIQLIGHNQVHPNKYCPSFYVPKWARFIGIDTKNIDFNNYANNSFIQ